MIKHLVFAAAVLAQIAIMAVSPIEQMKIRSSGRVITLMTRPVDPYDVMRGYHVTLSYKISEPPGFDKNAAETGETVYVRLKRDEAGIWNAEEAFSEFPQVLGEDRIVIKGRVPDNTWPNPILFGIEKYFVPEEMGERIEADVRDRRQRILVDVAVDDEGNAALLRLKVGENVYEY
jgi:uncharacterized membrane-anchored protein